MSGLELRTLKLKETLTITLIHMLPGLQVGCEGGCRPGPPFSQCFNARDGFVFPTMSFFVLNVLFLNIFRITPVHSLQFMDTSSRGKNPLTCSIQFLNHRTLAFLLMRKSYSGMSNTEVYFRNTLAYSEPKCGFPAFFLPYVTQKQPNLSRVRPNGHTIMHARAR